MIAQANSYRIPLADKSVHTIVTSPPYWGLRDYGLPPLVWGGRSDCRHEWGESQNIAVGRNDESPEGLQRRFEAGYRYSPTSKATGQPTSASTGQFCRHCSAWRGSFGLEPTPDLFVQHMVEIGREMWRVLRDDGQAWINLGDSFATSANGRSAADTKTAGNDDRTFRDKPFSTVGNGLKAKDLCMIPARVALALQADGWYLRQDIIWHKLNPMPESVTDRPTTAHEHVFLLTKQGRYFYDADAVREPVLSASLSRDRYPDGQRTITAHDYNVKELTGNMKPGMRVASNPAGRNLRSVWSLATEPFPGAHYATFPTKLVDPCIKAGTSKRGVCGVCGSPWERVVEKRTASPGQKPGYTAGNGVLRNDGDRGGHFIDMSSTTTGWRPTCDCPPAEPVPAIIFDPFCGSGTTGAVAHDLGRRFVGLDLSPVYLAKNALPRAEGKTSAAALAELPLFENVK